MGHASCRRSAACRHLPGPAGFRCIRSVHRAGLPGVRSKTDVAIVGGEDAVFIQAGLAGGGAFRQRPLLRPCDSSRPHDRPVMSRSRPRVLSRCSFHTALAPWSACSVVQGNRVGNPGRSRASNWCANCTAMAQSCRARPGAGTACARVRCGARCWSRCRSSRPRWRRAAAGRRRRRWPPWQKPLAPPQTRRARARGERRTVAWSGMLCAGLVQAIHSARISPSAAAWNISTAVLPGLLGTSATPHRAATSARWVALPGSRCALSRLAMPPTSRPPMALGWPVKHRAAQTHHRRGREKPPRPALAGAPRGAIRAGGCRPGGRFFSTPGGCL